MNEEWLMPGAIVPVNPDTTKALVDEIKRLIGVVGGMALQQAEKQEPVATLWQHGETGRTRITMPGDITDCDARWFKAADLYTAPQPQREWVGLTQRDIDIAFDDTQEGGGFNEFARAIEQTLKRKNT